MRDRLYPDGFLAAYRAAFGADPPEEFCEAYELLAEGLYFGTGLKDEQRPGKPGKLAGGSWPISDSRLLGPKTAVDRRASACARALRAWMAQGSGSPAGRFTPAPARGGDLAAVRRAGGNGPQRQEKGA